MTGPLVLVGGDECRASCPGESRLAALVAERGAELLVLPTAAAYEHPKRLGAAAQERFAADGIAVRVLDVLRRPDALDDANVAAVRGAAAVYLVGGSPMHLKAVVKETPLWEALVAAWRGGALVAAGGGAAMALGDPMVDPRGGAFTLGLGLVAPLAIITQHEDWTVDRSRRTVELAPADAPVIALDRGAAVIRHGDGRWEAVASDGSTGASAPGVMVTLGGHRIDLATVTAGPTG
jgi:cyanophycinase